MTPGAGTAQSVSRVGRRQMWRVAAGSWFCIGRFAALRRLSGRHKWRPHVWERLNVVLRRPVRGVARRGAIYDARCRNGTIGQPRWASADVACCGRFTVLLRPVRGIASVIRASQVAPLRLGAVECCFAVVIRVSRVAPLRLRRLNVVLRRSSGRHKWRPYVCGAVDCCLAVVIRASQMAPVRFLCPSAVWIFRTFWKR